MLRIINRLKPFFEDNYRRINVREYARLVKISPPTASKFLEELRQEGLLKKEKDKQYIYYYANKESELFIELLRIYWRMKLEKSGLLEFLEKELLSPVVILFGSLSKAEAKPDSDIDMAVFTSTKRYIDLTKYEKKLRRKIQLFIFKSISEVPENLVNNILNGYRMRGWF